MRRTRPTAAAGLAVFVAAASALALTQTTGGGSRQAAPPGAFAEAAATPASRPAAFVFEMNGFAYRVAANGAGRRTKGDRTRRFNLRLESGVAMEPSLFFSEYEGDLLLVYNVSGGEWAGGRVTRLEQPSMRALWNQDDAAGNVGPPLREGRFLYVTGVGFVGKLDLRSGLYEWKHDDLYDTREGAPKRFISFEAPALAGAEVLFRESRVYNDRAALTVRVDKRSGKINRIE